MRSQHSLDLSNVCTGVLQDAHGGKERQSSYLADRRILPSTAPIKEASLRPVVAHGWICSDSRDPLQGSLHRRSREGMAAATAAKMAPL